MIVLIYIPKLLTPEFILIYIWILQFEGNVTGQFSKVVHPYSTKMTLRGTEVAFEFQSFCCICQLAFTFCRSVKKPTELVTNRNLDRPNSYYGPHVFTSSRKAYIWVFES